MKSRSRDQDGLGAGRRILTGTSLLFKKSHDPGYDCKQAATAQEERLSTSTECSDLVPTSQRCRVPESFQLWSLGSTTPQAAESQRNENRCAKATQFRKRLQQTILHR